MLQAAPDARGTRRVRTPPDDLVVGLLERHLADLDRHITTLRKTRKKLQALTERAAVMDPSACTDPNRCQTITSDLTVGDRPKHRAVHLHAGPEPHTHH